MAAAVPTAAHADEQNKPKPRRQPNIVLYHSDQFRWDFLGANDLNGSTRTPNLDRLAADGVNFNHAVTNQPVCGPSRAVMLTGCYATEAGVWRNGLALRKDLPTLATELRKAGYSANYIGKWHLAIESKDEGGGVGPVAPEDRAGFLDHWEVANALEHTSQPYEGTIWDRDGKPIEFKDQYRVDFLTDRAERFLRQKHDKPFLLVVSQLEPHQQNDLGRMVGPKGAAEAYRNAFVPEDLRPHPGDWQKQLPDYYAACERIDASVGRLRKTLADEGLAEDTIFLFMSDHGCHFMTRNAEYKRSAHNSSIRIPLLMAGPGLEPDKTVPQIVGIVDLAPTLLEAAGVAVPASMKGKSFLPLVSDARARAAWPDQQLVQISETMTARALRTRDWTYCVVEPSGSTKKPVSASYNEYQLYDQRNDPHELVNLAGRKEYRAVADHLRDELKKKIVESGETEPEIVAAKLYP